MLQLKNTKNKHYLLDANAILRLVLKDNEEQYRIVKKIVFENYCTVPLEVVCEIVFVLSGVYLVPRDKIAEMLKNMINEIDVEKEYILIRALEAYTSKPKLDFVDCLMYGYHCYGYEVLTFDKKLNHKIADADIQP